MTKLEPTEERLKLAEKIRDSCMQAAIEARESAGISGLCHEGRWEVAIDSIKNVDLRVLVEMESYDSAQ